MDFSNGNQTSAIEDVMGMIKTDNTGDFSNLNGLKFSIHADFCIDTDADDRIPGAENEQNHEMAFRAMKMFQDYMPSRSFEVDLANSGLEGTAVSPARKVGARSNSDVAIVASPYDDENFGDCENLQNFSYFFGITTRPMNGKEFPSSLVEISDRLSAEPFKTRDICALTLRIHAKDQHDSLCPLALALNSKDYDWMRRGGRSQGMRMPGAQWIMVTLKEVIALKAARSGINMYAERTPLEWVEVFAPLAREAVADTDLEPVIEIDPTGRFVDFSHIGGENYVKDFAETLSIASEMAAAVNSSIFYDAEAFWGQTQNIEMLNEFIQFIRQIQEVGYEFDFTLSPDQSHSKAFYVTFDGTTVGKVTRYGDINEDDHPFNESVLAMGSVSTYVVEGEHLQFDAALLFLRPQQFKD